MAFKEILNREQVPAYLYDGDIRSMAELRVARFLARVECAAEMNHLLLDEPRKYRNALQLVLSEKSKGKLL